MKEFSEVQDNDYEAQQETAASLQVSLAKRVNFASAQNNVAIVRSLSLTNNTEEVLENVTVAVKATPPIIRSRSWTVDRIAADGSLSLAGLHTPLDIPLLAATVMYWL